MDKCKDCEYFVGERKLSRKPFGGWDVTCNSLHGKCSLEGKDCGNGCGNACQKYQKWAAIELEELKKQNKVGAQNEKKNSNNGASNPKEGPYTVEERKKALILLIVVVVIMAVIFGLIAIFA